MSAGKRMRALREKFNAEPLPLEEAVARVKEGATAKFDESIDAVARLGIDARKSEQAVRGAVMLPAGTGKTIRVAVMAKDDAAEAAQAAGADIVGWDDLLDNIKKGALEFEVLVAVPDAMRHLAAAGKILGPRGLMPNPKTGTVAADTAAAVKRVKGGQAAFRSDKGGNVHAPMGKASFSPEDLLRNVESFIAALKRAKPASSKGVYLRQLALSATMGAAVRVDLARHR